MKKRLLLVCLLLATIILRVDAQEKCYTAIHRANKLKENPSLKHLIVQQEQALQEVIENKSFEKRTSIIIPVVVHVIYKSEKENISVEQIKSQIKVLNDDFGFTNVNKLAESHPFYKFCAASGIEFKLANVDPTGKTTTGITRTKTTKDFWQEEEFDSVKFTHAGGINSWDPSSYLNIWVANFDNSSDVLGFAILPDQLNNATEYDGLVIRHEAFGILGTAGTNGFGNVNLGRTATHEIGHWLNLHHIWGNGDEVCGNDLVADTEPADSSNTDCPTFPYHAKNSCGSSENGEMFMNYMDYTSDACMNMFTIGQIERMKAAIETFRKKIHTSKGYVNTANLTVNDIHNLEIYPNPSTGIINIQTNNDILASKTLILVDILGNTVKTFQLEPNISQLNCEDVPNGIYFLQFQNTENSTALKLILNHE
jgi:hypothetical protein